MHAIVLAIGEVQIFLLRVLRERDIPHGTGSARVLVDERLFHERAVRLEHLNAIVDAVAYVEQPIDRELRAVNRVAELLRGRRSRIVVAEIHVLRLMAVRAPMTFVCARLGIVDDHAVIAVAVGNIDFVRDAVDERLCRQPQVVRVVAPFALAGLANLHQGLSGLGELQHHAVVEVALDAAGLPFVEDLFGTSGAACSTRSSRGGGAACRSRRLSTPVAADPHVAFVVDGDAMVRLRPVVARSRPTPMTDERSVLREFQHRRRGRAALRGGRIGRRMLLARLERPGAMNDPDVILAIHRHADRLAEYPVVGERLGPERVDLEPRRRGDCRLHAISEDALSHSQRAEESEEDRCDR